MSCALPVCAADLTAVEKLYSSGHYEDALKQAQAGLQEQPRDEDWPLFVNKCLLTLGRYPEAQTVMTNALSRVSWSIRLRLAARETLLRNGQVDAAKDLVQEIQDRISTRAWAYRDPPNVVALAQAALLMGADARRVLDNFLNRVKKVDPSYRPTYLVTGQLALDKYDYDLAAKTYQEALEKFPDDPEMLWGLAKSFSTGERAHMVEALQKALEVNERHVPSLLLLADHLIDAEDYKKADELIEKALAVNPREADAWSYRAVLAHLRTQPEQEQKAHEQALGLWKTNPHVDYLIGLKLSQKYRFKEGSQYQRRALKSDDGFTPAKTQLAQDLLRLGLDEEGWALAEDVYKQDGYDVVAYNLVTLHDTVAKFQILTNADFRVRMHPREASIYGERVVGLLSKAKQSLCKKYGIELPQRTVVEIFPEQKDFAVRTFSMPGGEGFLGVCFGNVITANSPASQATHRMNWESVLWHEFCHVVTLGLTKNKMPRWLSEGISVYEERQANPSWGQGMTAKYREMVLEGELTPVGELSSAFLAPKTPMHLQFAYYESSVVVEYLIDHFGLDAIRKILRDLGEGKSINQAIADNTAPLPQIEKEFAEFVKHRAETLAPDLDWDEPTPEQLARGEEDWISKHPNSLWGLTRTAKKLLSEKKWAEAKVPAEKLIQLYPEATGTSSAYMLLAQAHRGLNEVEQERAILTKLARKDAEALEAYQRLMELSAEAKDWKNVLNNADRFLAVNPLVPVPYRYVAQACEAEDQTREAVQAYRTLIKLDPPDPADIHYRLGRLLHKQGDPSAKRQILEALEEAPRFRDAHRLLLQMAADKTSSSDHAETVSPTPAESPNN